MQEDNIDISKGYAKNINIFLNEKFDYIITLCDEARDHCPHFSTKNNNIFHKSFKSPKKEDKKDYRRVRDEIKQYVQRLYSEIIQ
jgi:arsenate reductase